MTEKSYCTPSQWNSIEQFCNLLTEANKAVNLVSRRDIDKLMKHHVEPCFIYKILGSLKSGDTVLDIGSGGGFPGIINAILFPDTHFVLVDSTKKKVTFLQQAITSLQLQNVQAVWSRVEDLAKLSEYQHTFDHTTSRAVASLEDIIKWSIPLLKPSGTIEAMKGGNYCSITVKSPVCIQSNNHLASR